MCGSTGECEPMHIPLSVCAPALPCGLTAAPHAAKPELCCAHANLEPGCTPAHCPD
jgi:hypothetical protein